MKTKKKGRREEREEREFIESREDGKKGETFDTSINILSFNFMIEGVEILRHLS
jgi:hypothetical protein